MKQGEGGGGDTMTVLIINFVSRVNYYDAGSLVQPAGQLYCQIYKYLTENGEGVGIF